MKDDLAPQQLKVMGEYAGFVTRFVAFVIDMLTVTITVGTISIVSDFVVDKFPIGEITRIFVTILILLTNLTVYIGYYVGLWVFAGQTLGKALMGVRVISVDGGRITIRHALIRLAGYWLSAVILFWGYLRVLVDERRRALHDKLAGTLVVYSRNVGDTIYQQVHDEHGGVRRDRYRKMLEQNQQQKS
jgi:uncharacterized RDD family membrane protein YckC